MVPLLSIRKIIERNQELKLEIKIKFRFLIFFFWSKEKHILRGYLLIKILISTEPMKYLNFVFLYLSLAFSILSLKLAALEICP